MNIPSIVQAIGFLKYTPTSGSTIPNNFATMFLTHDCTLDVTDHFDHDENDVPFKAGYHPMFFKKIRSISTGSLYLCHIGNIPKLDELLKSDTIIRYNNNELNGYFRKSLNFFSNKVYYQHRNTVTSNYIRIWSPINDVYAQYWDIKDHDSTTDEYINLGRGGICEYYEVKNPDSHTGTLAGEGTSTSYLSTINATITISFNGSGIYCKFFADNRGGIIRYVLDGGAQTVEVSTYSASGTRKIVKLFSNLDSKKRHTVVGTFIGDDPSNPPSGGVSRGWIATDNSTTGSLCHEKAFWVVGSPTPNSAFPYTNVAGQDFNGIEFVGFSYKPFAFSIRKNGSAVAYKHVPNHETTGHATTFTNLATDRVLIAENTGNLLDTFTTINFAVEVDEMILRQTFKGHNSAEPLEELLQVTETITFTKDGVTISGEIETLQAIDVDIAYVAMFPTNTTKFDTLIFKNGEINTKITNGSNETLYDTNTIGNWDGNMVYVNKYGSEEEMKYSLVYTMISPSETLKVGTSSYGQYLFIDHRDATIQKTYPVVGDGIIIPSGVKWTWKNYLSCQLSEKSAYNKYITNR